MYYTPNKWRDFGDFYIYEDDQRNIGWKQVRIGRVTGSTVSYCVGNTHYADSTPEDMALYIAQVKEKPERPRGKVNKEQGVRLEPAAREWYTRFVSEANDLRSVQLSNIEVIEVGFLVPKFDPRLGASPDGLVIIDGKLSGLIEIKCPVSTYYSIKKYLEKGCTQTPEYNHIIRAHYDQMQMEMAIANLEWCDYVIYCPAEDFVFLERVFRNREYFGRLYEKIKEFIKERLDPALKSVNSMYPLIPK